jgi:hypothetical protein
MSPEPRSQTYRLRFPIGLLTLVMGGGALVLSVGDASQQSGVGSGGQVVDHHSLPFAEERISGRIYSLGCAGGGQDVGEGALK